MLYLTSNKVCSVFSSNPLAIFWNYCLLEFINSKTKRMYNMSLQHFFPLFFFLFFLAGKWKNFFCFSLDILHILVDDRNHKNITWTVALFSTNCTNFNHFFFFKCILLWFFFFYLYKKFFCFFGVFVVG